MTWLGKPKLPRWAWWSLLVLVIGALMIAAYITVLVLGAPGGPVF